MLANIFFYGSMMGGWAFLGKSAKRPMSVLVLAARFRPSVRRKNFERVDVWASLFCALAYDFGFAVITVE
jgi:hypothetical protein